jgi:hypothetical protein
MDKTTGGCCDQTVIFIAIDSEKAYPEALRRIVVGMWKPGSASGKDLCLFPIRLGGDFRSIRVLCVSRNHARFFQISQETRMHLRKELESPGLVGLHPGYFQNYCGETGDLGILRLRHLFQTSHVPFGNVRLLHKPENIVLVLDDLALAFRLSVAPLANMKSVAFTRKLLIRPFLPADPAVMSHPGLLPATQNQNIKSKMS